MKGPLHREKQRTRLGDEETTIVNLRIQLQAQTSRASNLQSRLTSALDTIEAHRLQHRQELMEERQARERLKVKLERLIEFTAHVEAERDETREGILAVLDRVEANRDSSAWPYAHMSIPDTLQPLVGSRSPPMDDQPAPSQATPASGHFAAVVAYLRSELEKERASHARTHNQAELEILTLRAQLARREAEFEARGSHEQDEIKAFTPEAQHDARSQEQDAIPLMSAERRQDSLRPGHAGQKQTIPPAIISPEEAARLLGLSVTRNKALEAEVKQLSVQLQKARKTDSPPRAEHPSADMSASNDPEMVEVVEVHDRGVEDNRVGEDDNDTAVNPLPFVQEPKTPGSPDLRPHVPLEAPSPFVMTPLGASTPLQVPKLLFVVPEHPDELLAQAEDAEFPQELDAPQDADEESRSPAMQMLEEDVRRLGTEIDAFTHRRGEMLMFVREQKVQDAREYETSPPSHDTPTLQGPSGHDDPAAVVVLREEIDSMKHRVTVCEVDIELLQKTLTDIKRPPSPPTLTFEAKQVRAESSPRHDVPLIIPASWDEDEEQSMDLATPLEPAIMPPGGPDTLRRPILTTSQDLKDLSPLLVPLPGSPAGLAPDLPSSPASRTSAIYERPPTPYSSTILLRDYQEERSGLGVTDDRVRILEQELEGTKRKVAEQDVRLVDLQKIIHDLRMQMRGLTR